MKNAPKVKPAERPGSRLLHVLHARLLAYMGRTGLVAFMADPAADAPAGGATPAADTLLGGGDKPAGDAPAGTDDKPAGDAPAGDAPAGDKPAADGKPVDAKPAGDKPKEDEPAGAPEKYEDFKLPEGLTLDAPVMDAFTALAKETNLPQATAQKFVDLAAQMQQNTVAQVQSVVEAQAEKWGLDSKADKEFGGDKFDENLAIAKTALDRFGTPELRTLLNQSKLGNHPEVLRFMFRAGQAISQDGFVPGRNGAPAKDARSMYSQSNMNP